MSRPKPSGPAKEPVWRGMTPEEQRAYIRALCRLHNERRREELGHSERRLDFVRPVYTGSYPDGR